MKRLLIFSLVMLLINTQCSHVLTKSESETDADFYQKVNKACQDQEVEILTKEYDEIAGIFERISDDSVSISIADPPSIQRIPLSQVDIIETTETSRSITKGIFGGAILGLGLGFAIGNLPIDFNFGSGGSGVFLIIGTTVLGIAIGSVIAGPGTLVIQF